MILDKHGPMLVFLVVFYWEASVANSQVNGDLRLNGYGTTPSRGKLEIFHDNHWGSICAEYDPDLLRADHFELHAANTVCRQLGLGFASVYYSTENLPELRFRYGHGSGPIHLDQVVCSRSEPHLLRCRHGDLGNVSNTCSHAKDVTVECSDVYTPYNGEVRLSNISSGLVELYSVGKWAAICHEDGFELSRANAVCRQLGYTQAVSSSALSGVDYNGSYWNLEGVALSCNSTPCFTSCLDQLPSSTLQSGCSPVSVQCAFVTENANSISSGNSNLCTLPSPLDLEGDIRLMSSSNNAKSGRVEVYIDGAWGTVCDRYIGYTESDVICKQLRFPGSLNYRRAIQPGVGDVHTLTCSGVETAINECTINTIVNNTVCGHDHDTGVLCADYTKPFGELSLREGVGATGNLIIFTGENYRPICSVNFGMTEAHVACKQMGYEGAITVRRNAFYRVFNYTEFDSHPFALKNKCLGNESHLLKCDQPLESERECREVLDEVAIQCATTSTPSVRLVGGETVSGRAISGRLEVNLGGDWGTVSNQDLWFNHLAAHVICTDLNYKTAKGVFNSTRFGEGVGPVLLNRVHCTGYESSVFDCQYLMVLEENTSHENDVGIECSNEVIQDEGALQLVGSNHTAGRLEIFIHGLWMSVCGTHFTESAANVACTQLGFPGATSYCTDSCFGEGNGFIYSAEDSCNGSEVTLLDCDRVIHNSVQCNRSTDVGLICVSPTTTDPTTEKADPTTLTTTTRTTFSTTDVISTLIPGLTDELFYIIVGVASVLLLLLVVVILVCVTCCAVKKKKSKQGTWRASSHTNGSSNGRSSNRYTNTHIRNANGTLSNEFTADSQWSHNSSGPSSSKLAMEKVRDFDDPSDSIEMSRFGKAKLEDSLKSNKEQLPSDYELDRLSHLTGHSTTRSPDNRVTVSTLYVEDSTSPTSPPPGYDELEFLPHQSHGST